MRSTHATLVLLAELEKPKATQAKVADVYRWVIEQEIDCDWPRVNDAIIERWSVSGLQRVKSMAWSGRPVVHIRSEAKT